MSIDATAAVVEQDGTFSVHESVYHDAEMFELEMERIFYSTWVYVAHESELPEPGDYRTSVIGTQPVIASRDSAGEIHVMLNRCMHRGAVVCRSERGHSNHFRCPYHNWVYDNSGALQGLAQRSGYPDDFNKDRLGLVKAARVGVYGGLIFASMKADVEPLLDRLASVRKYIDAWCNLSPVGRLRLAENVHRVRYPGNWKLQVENSVDGYHGNYIHESYAKVLERSGERTQGDITRARNNSSPNNNAKGLGHGDCLLQREGGTLNSFDFSTHPDYLAQLESAYGQEAARFILMQRGISVFPNLTLFESNLRVVRPVSPTEAIVDNHAVILEGVPDELNAQRLSNNERFFSSASFADPDDVEAFVLVQTGTKASGAQWLDFSRGLHREQRNEEGELVGHSSDETPQRTIYREWQRLMAMENR
jgi:benzoate/toluate 1,2-dioxygenase alpha subunit